MLVPQACNGRNNEVTYPQQSRLSRVITADPQRRRAVEMNNVYNHSEHLSAVCFFRPPEPKCTRIRALIVEELKLYEGQGQNMLPSSFAVSSQASKV